MEIVIQSNLDRTAKNKHRQLEGSRIRRIYRWFSTLFQLSAVGNQRLKSCYFAWGYWRVLAIGQLSLRQRLRLIARFLRVDWNVVHGHRPAEIAWVTALLARAKPNPGEIMLEAGCWQGGSTAKFSIVCALLGLRLHVYDSFEGVEKFDSRAHPREWSFGGQYACSEEDVRRNVEAFGEVECCEFHKGWFSATLAGAGLAGPVWLAYIDCDLAKGTFEALQSVVPALVPAGVVLSQDFHITPVRQMLLARDTWQSLRVGTPEITIRSVRMAQLHWQG